MKVGSVSKSIRVAALPFGNFVAIPSHLFLEKPYFYLTILYLLCFVILYIVWQYRASIIGELESKPILSLGQKKDWSKPAISIIRCVISTYF